MRRLWNKITSWKRVSHAYRSYRQVPITLHCCGFQIGNSISVEWESVVCVVAFKIDLVVVDDVRIVLKTDDKHYEISEDQEGFEEFIREAERQYHFPVDWWGNVVFPPFQRNQTILFNRDQQQGHP